MFEDHIKQSHICNKQFFHKMDNTDKTYWSFENICRLCLSSEEETLKIFLNDGDEKNIQISDLLKECCPFIEIQQNDNFPSNICMMCLTQLNLLYRFQQRCIASDTKLRQYSIQKNSYEWVSHFAECASAESLNSTQTQSEQSNETINTDDYKTPIKTSEIQCEGKENKQFMCNICSHCFPRRETLVRHKRTHTAEKQYNCTVCQKKLASATSLSHHKNIHTGQKPFQCKFCSKAYGDPSSLRLHLKRHLNQRDYKCSECNYSFFRNYELKNHIIIHHRTKPEEKFGCGFCNKEFSNPISQQRHEKLHHLKKTNICVICNRGYSSEATLKLHMKTHEIKNYPEHEEKKPSNYFVEHINENPNDRFFKCDGCTRSFSRRALLTKHIKNNCNMLTKDIM